MCIRDRIKNKKNIFDTEASALLVLFIDSILYPRRYRNISLLASSKFIEIDVAEFIDHQHSKKFEILLRSICLLFKIKLTIY